MASHSAAVRRTGLCAIAVRLEAGRYAQGLCPAKNPILGRSDRFQEEFRGEILKRHVALIDLAKGVQALREDD